MLFLRYLFLRLRNGAIVVLVVATLTYALLYIVPGGPFDKEKTLPPEIRANVERRYHLDLPLYERYLIYLKDLVGGDFGPSYKYLGRNVNDILAESLPVSAVLGGGALGLAFTLGLAGGIASFAWRGGWRDRAAMLACLAGISIPSFVLAALLVLILSEGLGLFPPALWETPSNLVLPALALGLGPAAYIARLTRSEMLEASTQDYVRTARAKGLSNRRVILKHVLRNSLVPVVTVLGPLLATLVTGSFVVEVIFAVPGMGRFFVTAVTNRDYPLIMGTTIVYSVLLVLANLAVDLLYAAIDPRIRLGGGKA